MKYDATIVITTYNYYDVTANCIDSIRRSVGDVPIILVDDASDDGSIQRLELNYPDVEIIHAGPIFSVSESWNAGIKRAFENGSDYACVINNDMEFPQPAWLDQLIRPFTLKNYEDTAVTNPMSYKKMSDDSVGIEYAGAFGCVWMYPLAHIAKFYPDNPMPVEDYENLVNWRRTGYIVRALSLRLPMFPTFAMYGGCFVVTPDTIRDVGWFDENYIFSHEETDYALRCWKNDRTVVLNKNSKVIHLGGTFRKDGALPGLYKMLLHKTKQHNKPAVRPEWVFLTTHPPQEGERLWKRKVQPYLKERGIIFHPIGLMPLEVKT